MNRIIRGMNIIYVGLLLIVLLFFNLQFKDAGMVLNEEVKHGATLSVDLMHLKIQKWVEENEAVISGARDFISNSPFVEDDIAWMLTYRMERHPIFKKLYYVTADNRIIGAEGESLNDVAQRGQLIKAAGENDIKVTAPFLSEDGENYMVAIVFPVKSDDGTLLGVVSGEMSLDDLKGILDDNEELGDSITYLMSSNDEKMLELNHFEAQTDPYETMMKWYEARGDEAYGMSEKNFGKTKGYFHYHKLMDLGWTLISYTPLQSYSDGLVRLQLFSLLLSAGTAGAFFILVMIMRAVITKPLLEFEEQVERIDFNKHDHQRIELSSNQALGKLSGKINHMLERIFEQVRELNDDRDELLALNEELEATYGQLVATEQEVTRQKQSFEALFRNAQDAIVMFDQNHRVLDINDSFTILFGYELREIAGLNLDHVVTSPQNREEAEAITTRVFDGELIRFEAVRYGKGGVPRQVNVQGVPMTHQGVMIGGYGIYSDISERKEREEHLAFISTHDELTGLYNRGHFEQLMEDIKIKKNLPIGLLTLDVNGLKLVNDAFGHKAGDGLLREIADRMKSISSEQDILARMGGDEFSVLMVNCDDACMEKYSKKLVESCNQIRVDEVAISVSIGYAIVKSTEDTYASAFKMAEDYLNKRKLSEGPSVRGKAIYTIVNTLHEKNKREEQHSKRVSELGYGFGKALKLSDREVNELKTIGLLHDVGKIAIEEKILNKEGKLSSEEYAEMQKHPAIGYRILSTVNEMGEIAEYVLAHHESWDGTGYPKGLKGRQIPYLSRIVTVIDAFDAMTSDRTYRKAMTYGEAFTELRRVSGIQFDAEIVEQFIEFIETAERG